MNSNVDYFTPRDPEQKGWIRVDGPQAHEGINIRSGDVLYVTPSNIKVYCKSPGGTYELANELASVQITNSGGIPTAEVFPVRCDGTLRVGSVVKYPTTMREPFNLSSFSDSTAFAGLAVANALNFNTDCNSGKFDSFAVNYAMEQPHLWYALDFGNSLTQPDGSALHRAINNKSFNINSLFGFEFIKDIDEVIPTIKHFQSLPEQHLKKLSFSIAEGLSNGVSPEESERLHQNAENQVKIWLARQGQLEKWFRDATERSTPNVAGN